MSTITFLVQFLPENNRLERIWKLAQIDFKKQYYNDRFGIVWALLNPLLRVAIYYVVFTLFMNRGGNEIPNFALFIFSALLFWMEFVQVSKKGMKLLYQKKYLIENIQVNKLDFFYSAMLTSLMSLSFNLSAYFIFAIFSGINFSIKILWLPILVLNLYVLAVGMAMILSTFYIFLKDLDHIYDIIILMGFWGSGVFFDPILISKVAHWFYYVNPFIGLFTNLRSIILYNSYLNSELLFINISFGVVVFLFGQYLVKNHTSKLFEYN